MPWKWLILGMSIAGLSVLLRNKETRESFFQEIKLVSVYENVCTYTTEIKACCKINLTVPDTSVSVTGQFLSGGL